MGSHQAQYISKRFGLSGRVDLYHAFILAMIRVLKPEGIAGIIVSNRFMSTRSGAPVRRALMERCNLRHIWDFGDTKLFNAAILPAVLLVESRKDNIYSQPNFTSIYEAPRSSNAKPVSAPSPVEALSYSGCVKNQGRPKNLLSSTEDSAQVERRRMYGELLRKQRNPGLQQSMPTLGSALVTSGRFALA